jgi:hypothetical protein
MRSLVFCQALINFLENICLFSGLAPFCISHGAISSCCQMTMFVLFLMVMQMLMYQLAVNVHMLMNQV